MQNQQVVQLFNSLGPVNGKLSGKAAHAFLLTSNLPTHSLKDIWTRSDKDCDGCLTIEEFSTALTLIKNFERGLNSAAANSMHAIPMVHSTNQWSTGSLNNAKLSSAAANWSSFSADQGRNSSPMKAGASTLSTVPASISSEMWVVDLNSKKRYLALFNRLDNRRTGSVHGSVVRGEFMQSGLSAQTLSQIWNLSDISNTGSLSADEFCLAMYLVENAQRGKDPPPALTPALVPPQYRHFLLKDQTAAKPKPDSIFTKASFENRKQENFNKGEAELERRRLELKERERKEAEEKEAMVAAAQELERQKAELQARRQLEFQRQRTKSLEVAAQKRQQEEEVQQTLYRNKMESWAVSRKQQLEGQLARQRELTTGLRTRKLLLDKELADLAGRRDQAKATLDSFVKEKSRIYIDIEKLNQEKAEILKEVGSARMAVQSSQHELATVTNDKLRLSQQLRARRNPEEMMVCILEDQEKAKQSLISLKTEHTDISTKMSQKQAQIELLKSDFSDIRERLSEKEKDLEGKENLLRELQWCKEQQETAARAKKEEAERAAALRAAEEKKLLDEKIQKIEETLKTSEDPDLDTFERIRLQSVKFNEFLSHQTEETNKNLEEAAAARQLATEAVDAQRSRLKQLVEKERQRHHSEQEEFQARVSRFTPRRQGHGRRDKVVYSGPKPGSMFTPTKPGAEPKPGSETKLGSAPRPAAAKPSPVVTDNLISLDTPPRPTPKQTSNSDFLTDLTAVLSSPPPVGAPSKLTEIDLNTAELQNMFPTTQQLQEVGRRSMQLETDKDSTLGGGEEIYQVPGGGGGEEEEDEWNREDYQEPESIYMNVDPTGLLSSRSPEPINTSTSQSTMQSVSDTTIQSNRQSVSETTVSTSHMTSSDRTQGDEHIYALATEVTKQPKEVLFEVETLVDYIGTTVDELSFSKGIRISVYEVRGSYYYGELEGRTGLVALNHVEKCEWIYGDLAIDKEVIGMYDYQSDVDGDLSFVAGEVIKVTEDLGEWYRGSIGDRTGIFPGNYVQVLDEDIKDVSGATPPPNSALPAVELKPLCTGTMIEGYVTEDIELDEGDEVSVLAQPDLLNVYIEDSGGRRTWIKTELLKINQDLETTSNGPVGADRIPASLHCYSLYPYSAQNNDELTLKRDDIITITEQSDPHWWIGRLGGEVGVLPANYVQQINDQDTWETVKAWNANLTAAEDERTRQEAIHELISTEKTYIDDLLLVVEVFYNPLCSVATDEELSNVFVNWQQLILCNARLFRALYNNSDINSFESVGAVFLEEIDSLVGPYTKFCSAQRQAMIALQEGVSHDFKVKEKECAASPKVGKLPLSTFLLKPMQRITKYPLLIRKILQHTRDTHPDYQSLKDSLSRTEHLLTSVNEAVRATTRLESLQRVFDKCCDDLGERVRLNSNTNCLGPRKLVHFGSVYKNKGSKELFAILFTDMLWLSRVDKGRYGNKPIDIDARDFDVIKFEPYRDPFLLNIVFPTENNKNSADLTFAFSYNDRNYSFHCQTPKEASDWVDHLNDAIRNATLLYHSHYKTSLPDPTIAGQATITLRIVEGLELALPPDEKPNSLFVQASLLGHVQKTPVGAPKWDHTVHFVVQDVTNDKINITVFKENLFSPNVSLGKFDLSIQKLLKTGGPGPWNKRLILTDTNSGMVNVCIMLRYNR